MHLKFESELNSAFNKPMPMNASTRAERIEIRATAELKASLEKAARLQDQSLSAFVLSASREAAKDEAAVRFYLGYGFEPSPVDATHLYLLTQDIRKTLA